MEDRLLPAHRPLLIGQALGGLLLNLPLNGALAWFTFPAAPAMPLLARGPCVAADTAGTSFCLPLFTCLVLTAIVRRGLRAGRIPRLARLPAGLRSWPAGSAARGALIGLLCALTLAPLSIAALHGAGVEALDRGQMALYKALYSGLLGLLVTPLFGWRALAD